MRSVWSHDEKRTNVADDYKSAPYHHDGAHLPHAKAAHKQTDRQTDRERGGDVGVSIRLCRGGGKARGLVRYVRYNELFIQRRTSSVSERHGRLKAVVIININPILACADSDAGPRLLLKLLLQTLPVHYQHPW